MSDDIRIHPDGCIHFDDARRLAKGRTLVNLDNVYFEPILAALNPLSEVARHLAATGAPELVFQFTDRWTELENVLAASGLTANAASTCDLKNESSRRRHEVWDYLRGFLRDVRTKYAPQDPANHNVLAKRLAVAVEMVQVLTPSEPPPEPGLFPEWFDEFKGLELKLLQSLWPADKRKIIAELVKTVYRDKSTGNEENLNNIKNAVNRKLAKRKKPGMEGFLIEQHERMWVLKEIPATGKSP